MAEQAGEVWVWVSFAPEYRLVLATHVGGHEEHDAEELVKQRKTRVRLRIKNQTGRADSNSRVPA